jgi:hypothetical protein
MKSMSLRRLCSSFLLLSRWSGFAIMLTLLEVRTAIVE